ncbi:cadherin domain-containing protein [Rhizobium herbae]|uniref:Ca2+-binding RTX toxin-like protein n=1 Tax=Rhizobium herbae TaxID=508661 RepID=A0ABS4ERF6_9HYPH|nr:cadherin domain-containing protein [Rhizobium herbae]MBP1860535.1 Ca2+-binding RTX toxin-like protein [Rhizobium herbae]
MATASTTTPQGTTITIDDNSFDPQIAAGTVVATVTVSDPDGLWNFFIVPPDIDGQSAMTSFGWVYDAAGSQGAAEEGISFEENTTSFTIKIVALTNIDFGALTSYDFGFATAYGPTYDEVEYEEGIFLPLTIEEDPGAVPTATDDTASAGKNIRTTINVLANDTDSDGTIDPTTVTVVDGPDHGTFSVNATTGVITYTPTKDYVGSDSFTYTVKDNDGNVSGEATVTIGVDSKLTLTSSNEAFAADALAIGTVEVDGGAGDDYLSGSSNPSTAGADTFYGGDGNDIIFGATGNDYIEGNAGNDYLRSGSGNDTLVGGEGNDTYGIRFFANKTSSTVDTGTVTIIDDDGVLWNGAPRPATVPSEWSSQPPAAAGYQITGTATSTGEGTWDLVVADDNGGTKTFALTLDGDDLKIVGGSETVTIKDYINGKFGITLDGVVVPTPVATADSAATVKDLSKTIDVLANDTDADGTLGPTTVTIVDGPLHGTLTVNATTGVITYKPTAGYVGADSFTYTVKDDAGNTSNVAAVTLDVAAAHILTSGDDVFSGDTKGLTASGIEVHGGAGDDYIVTSNQVAMPDTIYGDDGNDLIFTGRGDDYVEGGAGNDVIHARAGNDTVIGGAGDDTYVVRFTDTGTTTITDDDGTLFHGTFTPASIPASWSPAPGATSGFGISGEATIVSEGVWSLAVIETSGTVHTLTLTLTDGDLTIVESGKPQTVVIKDYVNGTFGITLASENHAPTNLALSNDNVDENSDVGTVVGTLSATDPEGGAVTYTLAQPSDYFEIVGNQIKVKGSLDYETIASHDLTIVASDADGNTTQQTFEIGVNDLDEAPTEPSKGTITIDVSGSGTTGVDFEAYMRGGFISDTVGGGFPSFDNSSAFIGEEMFIGYGTDATSKYVLAHGNLEYSFGTHTIVGEINTIEFGTRGTGSFDSNGYFTGADTLLKITGLTFANGKPANSTEEAQIEANGLVHLFGIAHMYGNSTDPDTAAKVAAALDKIADGLDAYAQHFIGSAGADIYAGTQYSDEIEGGAGNDLLSGGSGDDTITGGAGSDIIAGGFGSDTATYGELKSAYTVTDNEDGTFTVLDTVAGTSDTLTGVEFLRFKDVIVDLSDGSEEVVGEPPENIQLSASTVAENATVGTVVGTLSAVDPDGGTVSFALTGAVSDKFEIVGNELRLKAGIDFETAQSHEITVRVTDSFGSTTDKTFTIGVTDVNEAPVSLALTKTSVAESAAVGTVVGTLSAADPEDGVLTYTLGADTDGKFEIVGNQLRVKAGLNYEADASHPITVIVKDAAGNSTSRNFTIKVTNVDEAPGSVTLSKATVAENASVGTTVGTLSAVDPEGGDVVYSLSSNPGGMFKIVDNKLQVAKALNYETGASYTIKVDAIDVGGNTTVKTFTIGVTDINEAPGSVALSKATVAENSAVGTTIGTLSAVDPEGKALTYKLTDNAGGLFKLDGNKLQLAKSVNYETLKSDTITVEVKDAGGLTVTKTFTIGVTDVNEAPGSVALSKATVAENTKVGTTVGTFSAIDPEGKALTYKLADNAGGLFKLDGNKLQVAKGIDYETVQSDTIKVEVKDAGGLTVTKTFTIGVTDVLETITGTSASQTIKGGIGADKIVAGAGNDTLQGLGGNDKLYGDAGNDKLYGGLGADDLTGGAGSDTFQFKALSDSTVASSGRDTIFDFSGIGGDRIDLSGIDASTKASGDQAFSFLGTASFTGKAGELRYEKQASDTYVYADVNGDKKADFAIHLDDAVTLTKGYFVL